MAPTKQRVARKTQQVFGLHLRVLSVLQLLTGIALIVFSVFLQFPPGDSLTL